MPKPSAPAPLAPAPAPALDAAPADAPNGSSSSLAEERPEVLAGAAFAGGFLVALILKRLGN
jgi:hypothetical protein